MRQLDVNIKKEVRIWVISRSNILDFIIVNPFKNINKIFYIPNFGIAKKAQLFMILLIVQFLVLVHDWGDL